MFQKIKCSKKANDGTQQKDTRASLKESPVARFGTI